MKALILAATFLAPVSLLQAEATPVHWKGSSEIQFSGTSTLHEWAGKVTTQPFTATVLTDEAGQPVRLDATVQVKVAGMDTAEADRDKNLRKAMNVTGFPLITGTMDAPFTQIMDQRTHRPAALPLKLELLGRKHNVAATISHWAATSKTASFDLDFDLSLKECGITVPTILFVIRVGDTINLHANVKLARSND